MDKQIIIRDNVLEDIFCGATQKYWLELTRNEEPLNITGSTVYFILKNSELDLDSEALISVSVTNHFDPENGKTLIHLTPRETAIPLGMYFFSLSIKDTNNNIAPLMTGYLVVKAKSPQII